MKKHLIRGTVTFLTFFIGLSATSLLLVDLFPDKTLEDLKVMHHSEASQELTFEPWGVIACGSDFSGRTSYTSSKASDGAIIDSTLIYGIKTGNLARKRFKYELRHANVIEQTENRAVIEKAGEIRLIVWGKNSWDSDLDFSLSIIKAPSLKHLMDFEKQKISFETSLSVNQLKP